MSFTASLIEASHCAISRHPHACDLERGGVLLRYSARRFSIYIHLPGYRLRTFHESPWRLCALNTGWPRLSLLRHAILLKLVSSVMGFPWNKVPRPPQSFTTCSLSTLSPLSALVPHHLTPFPSPRPPALTTHETVSSPINSPLTQTQHPKRTTNIAKTKPHLPD